MKYFIFIHVLVLLEFLAPVALGNSGSHPEQTRFLQGNSKCVVEKFPMEKPIFQIFRGGQRVSQPDFACSGKPEFSPSGKLIAFTHCERDYNRLGDAERIYPLVIFNCETGLDRGFLGAGFEHFENWSVKQWAQDESGIQLRRNHRVLSEEEITLKFNSMDAVF